MSWFMIRRLVLTVGLALSVSAVAVAQAVEAYKVKIVTAGGNRFRGTLDDVSDEYIYLDHEGVRKRDFIRRVPLTHVRKVVLRQQSKRKSTIEGAIIGGLITGFVVVQSAKKSGFRSPVLYGVNLVMGAGGGAAAGALIGHSIGSVSAKTIRPFRSGTVENVNESLRRQLVPFTYTYQSDVLNRATQ